MSIFAIKAEAQPDVRLSRSYCISASYYGCRVTITCTDESQAVTDCIDYRVP